METLEEAEEIDRRYREGYADGIGFDCEPEGWAAQGVWPEE